MFSSLLEQYAGPNDWVLLDFVGAYVLRMQLEQPPIVFPDDVKQSFGLKSPDKVWLLRSAWSRASPPGPPARGRRPEPEVRGPLEAEVDWKVPA
jgi:hypothetical protein